MGGTHLERPLSAPIWRDPLGELPSCLPWQPLAPRGAPSRIPPPCPPKKTPKPHSSTFPTPSPGFLLSKCCLPILKAKAKRVRTTFSSEQLARLEQEFARQQYLVGAQRGLLASTLHLTEEQVIGPGSNRPQMSPIRLVCLPKLPWKGFFFFFGGGRD